MKTAAASTVAPTVTDSSLIASTSTTAAAGQVGPTAPTAPTTPADSTTANIEARLARLERSVRRWRLVGAAAVVVMVGMGAVGGETVPEEIRARRFVVENYAGESRGVFGYLEQSDKVGSLMLVSQDKVEGLSLVPGNPKIKYVKADGTTVYVE